MICATLAAAALVTAWAAFDVSKFVQKVFKNKIDHFNFLDNLEYDQRRILGWIGSYLNLFG